MLTKDQVEAVRKFSDATENYGQLPGETIRSYRDVVFTRQALRVGREPTKEDAGEQLDVAISQRDAQTEQAGRADQAVRVIDDYSKFLSLLVAENYTEDLNASASELGSRLDSAIGLYNSRFVDSGPGVESFGKLVAAGIRGAGGIWIKHRQSVALREAVTKGDPAVQEMTKAIESLCEVWLTPANGKTVLDLERDELRNAYLNTQALAMESDTPLDLGTTLEVVAALDRAREATSIAKAAKAAAIQYRNAHAQLAEAVHGRGDLKNLLAQIDTLAAEIKKAQKLLK